jgi:uncharacterized phiE125 gp8 family phage protein
MTIALTAEPAVEPLTLDEVKAHLRIDHIHEDTLLLDTLRAARSYTEFASQRRIITQEWRQYEACAPESREIDLRVGPVQAVTAVTVYDIDGTPSVLAETDYSLAAGGDPKALTLAAAFDTTRAANGLEIDLTAGFGDAGIEAPDVLRRAILLLIAHWYEFRGAVPAGDQPVSLPPGYDALLQPFRQVRV